MNRDSILKLIGFPLQDKSEKDKPSGYLGGNENGKLSPDKVDTDSNNEFISANLKALISYLYDLGLVSNEETGFPNSTNSYTTFDLDVNGANPDLIFTISPVGSSFDIYVKKRQYTFTEPISIQIPKQEGELYLFFDDTGNLDYQYEFDESIIKSKAFVYASYFDNDNNEQIADLNERHGLNLPGDAHALLHNFLGSEYKTGFDLEGFTIGNGSLDSHAQFTCSAGTWNDEDIPFSFTSIAQFPIYYRLSTNKWRRKLADSFPFLQSGSNGYTGANGRPCYNQLSGGVRLRTELSEGSYFLMHYAVYNDETQKVCGFLGTNEYFSPYQARNNIATEINEIKQNLFLNEFIFIDSVLFETSSAFANSCKARVVNFDLLSGNYTELRPINPKNLLSLNTISGYIEQKQINQSMANFEKYIETDFVDCSVSGTANVSELRSFASGGGSVVSFGNLNGDTDILNTVTSATAYWRTNNGVIIINTGNYELWLDFDLLHSLNSTATQRYISRVGASATDFISDAANSFGIRYTDSQNSGNIVCFSRSGGVESVLNSSIPSGATKAKAKIQIINGTDMNFYINEIKVAGSITTNIPLNTVLYFGSGIQKTVGNTAVTQYCDYFKSWKFNYTGR